MLMSDPLLFILALMDTGAVLFLLIFFIITLSDLECDYLNSLECCSRLNQWVMPKLIAHVFLTILLLIHCHWYLVIFNLPMVTWMVFELIRVPRGNLGLYDPVDIHNRGQLKAHMRDCMIHLGYYLIIFFIYLYCLITSMLRGDPINRQEENEIVSEF